MNAGPLLVTEYFYTTFIEVRALSIVKTVTSVMLLSQKIKATYHFAQTSNAAKQGEILCGEAKIPNSSLTIDHENI